MRKGCRHWISLVTAMMMALILGAPWLVRAEEEPAKEKFPDRLMIRGGWAYVFGVNADVTLRGDRTGIGTSVDFSKTLGGDSSTNALRIDTLYRFNERHAVGFSWYRVALGGENTLLDQQIQIGGNTINANATVHSDLDLNLYRLIYNYSFYHSDKAELGLSPGLYMAGTKFDLTAQGNIILPNNQPSGSTGVNETLTVPLPSFGLFVNYHITPRFQFQVRADFFYINVSNYEGAMFEYYAGLEYRVLKHFAIGAAYDRLSAALQDTTRGGFEFDMAYNLAFFYGTLYFF
ncbi:MAG TPA: hypothetical protein VJ805_10020 [Nitrospiraceae bacterium]|nr:hypothetical protein [Nitrospiraceae bacterium]